jgi:hypothetical protein
MMRIRIARNKAGGFAAAAVLDDEGLVPEVVPEDGVLEMEEVVELRQLEFVEDLDGTIERLGGKGRK